MAIYTEYGVEVKIIKRINNFGDVQIQAVDDETWVRERNIIVLRATNGLVEIEEAIKSLTN